LSNITNNNNNNNIMESDTSTLTPTPTATAALLTTTSIDDTSTTSHSQVPDEGGTTATGDVDVGRVKTTITVDDPPTTGVPVAAQAPDEVHQPQSISDDQMLPGGAPSAHSSSSQPEELALSLTPSKKRAAVEDDEDEDEDEGIGKSARKKLHMTASTDEGFYLYFTSICSAILLLLICYS